MSKNKSNSHFRGLHIRSGKSRAESRMRFKSENFSLGGYSVGVEEFKEPTPVKDTRLKIVPSNLYFSDKLKLMQYYIYDKESLERLRRHVSRVLRGSFVDYKSPFVFLINKVIGTSDELMNDREPIKDYLRDLVHSNPTIVKSQALLERELKEIDKIGTTSISLPWNYVTDDGRGKRVNAIQYYSFKNTSIDFNSLDIAVGRVKDLISGDSYLRRLPLVEALRRSEKTTNWGLPFWLRGNELLNGKRVADYHYDIASLLESKKLPFFKCLTVLVERVQPNGTDEPKQRAAMAFPHYITLIESTFQVPLLNHLRKFEGFEEYVEEMKQTKK
uniref:Uncharacterized protein n=1 Tax=viral metagenome TaxID=1070528 RepID=A0A2V0RBP6_9ZZZZ